MQVKEEDKGYHETAFTKVHHLSFAYSSHIHTEYELAIVDKGEGKLCFGNALLPFGQGDIMFLAPTLSHSCHEGEGGEVATGRMIQFSATLLPHALLQLPASTLLQQLVERSSYGILFSDVVLTEELSQLLGRIQSAKGVDQLHLIYKMLALLCRNPHYRLVSQIPLREGSREHFDDDAIERVNRYINLKYAERIQLEELAAIAGLSKCAFCRAYKKQTYMTPFEFLTTVRIQNAGRILALTNRTIGEIAYECGYPHISQFNKQFVKVMAVLPSEYRRLIKGKKQ
ncbi:MAG: AraC family transcriptional regulator [Bacteroidaceae bacterium]